MSKLTFLEQVAEAEGLIYHWEPGRIPSVTNTFGDSGWVIYQTDVWEFSLYEFNHGPEIYYRTYHLVEDAIKAARTELT